MGRPKKVTQERQPQPGRACPVCAKSVDYDGYCIQCDDYRAPRIGTNVTDRRCTQEENLRHLRALRKMLAAKGTPMSRAMLAAVEEVPF